jgi:hypothetical protein
VWTRNECVIRWLATVLPQPAAEAPERVLVNFACVLIGVSALAVERPGSLLALWPEGVVTTWAMAMAAGGAFALVGYWNYPRRYWARPLERLGYLGIFLAASVYGVGVIVVFGWQGAFSGTIYLSIALAEAVRLLVTSAYRTVLLQNGGDGEAH